MSDDVLDAYQAAEQLLPLYGPYDPDRVIEAARTIGELVRRLNHATIHASALRYPPQVNRTVGALRSALFGLDQTLDQLATRLDAFSADLRVQHDSGGDPAASCAEAANDLRQAAAALGPVTAPLTKAGNITSYLGYDTTRRGSFPRPQADVHTGQHPDARGADAAAPPQPRPGRSR